MKSGKTIDISKSSLVSLKAELIRKKEEAEKLKGSETYLKLPPKPKPEVKSNPGVSQRNEKDVAEELSTEEVDLLKKSKDVLTIKAALYDQLQSGSMVSEDGKSRFLVDFENKDKLEHQVTAEVGPLPPTQSGETGQRSSDDDGGEGYEDDDDDSEWVEYKDCLGRSRKCLRADLSAMKRRDEFLSKAILKEIPKKEEPSTSTPKTEDEELRELVSNDMHLEEMRKKWEQKEMELLSKQNVYYEDLLFDEARSHGVGYWKFSTNEGKRLEEQEMLRKVRTETEQKQKEAKALRDRREQQRQARLIAARQRQRARLGLPPIDPKDIPEASKEPEPEPQEKEEVKEDLEVRLRKAAHVRPWDVGKDGVQQPVMTQEEWVEKKRDERVDEFAPKYEGQADAPPASVDILSKKKRRKKKKKLLEQNLASERTPFETEGDLIGPFPPEGNPMFSRTKNFLKKRETREALESIPLPTPGPSGLGAAVPPPMDFDYHTTSSTKRQKYTPTTLKATADAIDAGLRLLREQVESSQQATPKNTHMDT